MAKHGKELSDDTKKDIIKLNESGYRASQVAQSLTISKSTISRLLKAKHFGNTPYLFQNDNVPCHRSRVVEEWKRQNQLTQLNWPAQSPDLCPIENLWLLMKNKIKNETLSDSEH
jgi:IS30 family transposase